MQHSRLSSVWRVAAAWCFTGLSPGYGAQAAGRRAIDWTAAVLFVGEVTGHIQTASLSHQYAEVLGLGIVSRSKPHSISQLRPLQHCPCHQVMRKGDDRRSPSCIEAPRSPHKGILLHASIPLRAASL